MNETGGAMCVDPATAGILVSGGSRGLGLATVRACLERGARVATFARNPTEAVKALSERFPDRFRFAPLDATDDAAVEAFVGDAATAFGGVQGLVNNAAIGQDHLLANMPQDEIGRLIEINLRAPIVLTRLVLRRMMLQTGPGCVVNVTSLCGVRGFAGLTVYSATKGALDAFTRSLAREVAGRDIRVNAVAPGFFASEMSDVLAADQIEIIRRRTPTGRLVTEGDITPTITRLLFDEANVTGQTIHIDGGYTS